MAVIRCSLDLTNDQGDFVRAEAVAPHGAIRELYYRVSFDSVTIYLTPKQAGELASALDAVDEGDPVR